jgi:carbonic anhydrase
MRHPLLRASFLATIIISYATWSFAEGANVPAPSTASEAAAQPDSGHDEHTDAALDRASNADTPQTETVDVKPKVITETIPSDDASAAADDQSAVKIDSKPLSKKPGAKKETKSAKASPTKKSSAPAKMEVKAEKKSEPATAETSLRWLQNGNTRYLKKTNRADGKSMADRKRLLAGEKPHAIVLSCSDSRVPPEVVFDQALGEIYVIRVAGEALDSSVIASIEYAVENLGPQLLVVMGHSQCSAVEAAINFKEGDTAPSSDFERLLSDIKPRLKTVIKDKPSQGLEVESAVNADGVARDLVRRSDVVRKKVEAGQLTIKTALYRMDTGKVTFY